MNQENPPSRKRRLCALLRSAAACFIEQTSGSAPADIRESSTLRNEADSLITLYESGDIDPVLALQNADFTPKESDAQESVPLTGAKS